MSDNDRLTQIYNTALNSEDAAMLQQAATMDSLQTKLNNLKNTFTQFYTTITGGEAIKSFVDMVQSLIDTFNEGLPGVLSGIGRIMQIISAVKIGGSFAQGAATSFITGRNAYNHSMDTSIGGRIASYKEGFAQSWKTQFGEGGKFASRAFATERPGSKSPQTATEQVTAQTGAPLKADMQSNGQDVVAGLVQGIKAGEGSAKAAGKSLATVTEQGFTETLGIHSPALEMNANGQYFVTGLVEGIQAAQGLAVQEARELATAVLKAFETQLALLRGPGAMSPEALLKELAGNAMATGRPPLVPKMSDAEKKEIRSRNSAAWSSIADDYVQDFVSKGWSASEAAGVTENILRTDMIVAGMSQQEYQAVMNDLVVSVQDVNDEMDKFRTASAKTTQAVEQTNKAVQQAADTVEQAADKVAESAEQATNNNDSSVETPDIPQVADGDSDSGGGGNPPDTPSSGGRLKRGWKAVTSFIGKNRTQIASVLQVGGAIGSMLINAAAAGMEDAVKQRQTEGWADVASGVTQGLASALTGDIGGLIMGVFTGVRGLVNALSGPTIEQLEANYKKATEKAAAAKATARSEEQMLDSLKQLALEQYNSAESAEAYREKLRELAELHPELISGYDKQGQAIGFITQDYDKLLAQRREEARLLAAQKAQKAHQVADQTMAGATQVLGNFAKKRVFQEYLGAGLNLDIQSDKYAALMQALRNKQYTINGNNVMSWNTGVSSEVIEQFEDFYGDYSSWLPSRGLAASFVSMLLNGQSIQVSDLNDLGPAIEQLKGGRWIEYDGEYWWGAQDTELLDEWQPKIQKASSQMANADRDFLDAQILAMAVPYKYTDAQSTFFRNYGASILGSQGFQYKHYYTNAEGKLDDNQQTHAISLSHWADYSNMGSVPTYDANSKFTTAWDKYVEIVNNSGFTAEQEQAVLNQDYSGLTMEQFGALRSALVDIIPQFFTNASEIFTLANSYINEVFGDSNKQTVAHDILKSMTASQAALWQSKTVAIGKRYGTNEDGTLTDESFALSGAYGQGLIKLLELQNSLSSADFAQAMAIWTNLDITSQASVVQSVIDLLALMGENFNTIFEVQDGVYSLAKEYRGDVFYNQLLSLLKQTTDTSAKPQQDFIRTQLTRTQEFYDKYYAAIENGLLTEEQLTQLLKNYSEFSADDFELNATKTGYRLKGTKTINDFIGDTIKPAKGLQITAAQVRDWLAQGQLEFKSGKQVKDEDILQWARGHKYDITSLNQMTDDMWLEFAQETQLNATELQAAIIDDAMGRANASKELAANQLRHNTLATLSTFGATSTSAFGVTQDALKLFANKSSTVATWLADPRHSLANIYDAESGLYDLATIFEEDIQKLLTQLIGIYTNEGSLDEADAKRMANRVARQSNTNAFEQFASNAVLDGTVDRRGASAYTQSIFQQLLTTGIGASQATWLWDKYSANLMQNEYVNAQGLYQLTVDELQKLFTGDEVQNYIATAIGSLVQSLSNVDFTDTGKITISSDTYNMLKLHAQELANDFSYNILTGGYELKGNIDDYIKILHDLYSKAGHAVNAWEMALLQKQLKDQAGAAEFQGKATKDTFNLKGLHGFNDKLADALQSALTTGVDETVAQFLTTYIEGLTANDFTTNADGSFMLKLGTIQGKHLQQYMGDYYAQALKTIGEIKYDEYGRITVGKDWVDTYQQLMGMSDEGIQKLFTQDMLTGNYVRSNNTHANWRTRYKSLIQKLGITDEKQQNALIAQMSRGLTESQLTSRSNIEKAQLETVNGVQTLQKALDVTGVSTTEAAALIQQFGFTVNDFATMADGNFQLITSAQVRRALQEQATLEDIQVAIKQLEESNDSRLENEKAILGVLRQQEAELKAQTQLNLAADLPNNDGGATNFSDRAFNIMQGFQRGGGVSSTGFAMNVESLKQLIYWQKQLGLSTEYLQDILAENKRFFDGNTQYVTMFAGQYQSAMQLASDSIVDYARQQQAYWMAIAEMYENMDGMSSQLNTLQFQLGEIDLQSQNSYFLVNGQKVEGGQAGIYKYLMDQVLRAGESGDGQYLNKLLMYLDPEIKFDPKTMKLTTSNGTYEGVDGIAQFVQNAFIKFATDNAAKGGLLPILLAMQPDVQLQWVNGDNVMHAIYQQGQELGIMALGAALAKPIEISGAGFEGTILVDRAPNITVDWIDWGNDQPAPDVKEQIIQWLSQDENWKPLLDNPDSSVEYTLEGEKKINLKLSNNGVQLADTYKQNTQTNTQPQSALTKEIEAIETAATDAEADVKQLITTLGVLAAAEGVDFQPIQDKLQELRKILKQMALNARGTLSHFPGIAQAAAGQGDTELADNLTTAANADGVIIVSEQLVPVQEILQQINQLCLDAQTKIGDVKTAFEQFMNAESTVQGAPPMVTTTMDAIETEISDVKTALTGLGTAEDIVFDGLIAKLNSINTPLQAIIESINTILISLPKIQENSKDSSYSSSSDTSSTAQTSAAVESLNEVTQAADATTTAVDTAIDAVSGVSTVKPNNSNILNALTAIQTGAELAKNALINIPKQVVTNIFFRVPSSKDYRVSIVPVGGGGLGGHFMQTKAEGGVSGGGKTLVGQLGPELLVRGGYSYILGEQGAEFVDLQRGDIVFDAERTKKLRSGKPGVRGTAMAHGGIVGPAMANGSNADRAREIARSWGALANSLSNLLDAAGGGGGGGGGGDKYEMDLERWFNWLRQIAAIEKQISVLQAKRQREHGKFVAGSLIKENDLLAQQAALYKSLADSQEEYRKQQQKDIQQKYGRYFYFLQDNTMQINFQAIKADTEGNQQLGDALQKAMDEYTELTDTIADNIEALENAMNTIVENTKVIQDAYISMENEILSALQNSYEKEIKLKQDALDKKRKADDEYLESLRKNLDQERKLRDQNNQDQEILQLQRKITLMEKDTSGKSAKQLAKLREDLKKSREQLYFDKRDDAITSLEEAFKTQQEAYEKDIEALQEANDIKLSNMKLYWDQVAKIVATGQTGILDFLKSNSEEYMKTSALQQQVYLCQWNNTVGVALEYANVAATCWFDRVDELIKKANELNYEVNGNPAELDSTSSAGGSTKRKLLGYSYQFTFNGQKYTGYGNQQAAESKLQQVVSKFQADNPAEPPKALSDWKEKAEQSIKIKQRYATGGLVDFTGPAWVDGTPTKPEAFLSAKDTANMLEMAKLLRDMSLTDIRQMNREMTRTTYSDINNNGVTMGDVHITIESGIVANAVQAQALSKSVAEELMHIARQTGTVSVKRR